MSVTGSAVDFLGESMRASPVETATEPPSREERKGVKQVEELAQILDIPLLPSSNLRTPSFVECVSAARRRRREMTWRGSVLIRGFRGGYWGGVVGQ